MRIADVERRLVQLVPKYPEFRGMSFAGYQQRIARKYKCPKCGKPVALRVRHADGVVFFGCSDFPRCKWSQSFGRSYNAPEVVTPIGGWKPWDLDGHIPERGIDSEDECDDYESDQWASNWESPL